jgi:Holliday junction resolvase RusA-like endonuclease
MTRKSDAIEIVLDLPLPPSTNRIWRSGGGRTYRSPEYTAWWEDADRAVIAAKSYPKRKINGPFEVHISLKAGTRGDLDNRIKPLLDWAQSREIIDNDKDCQRLVAERKKEEAECIFVLRRLGVA